MTFFSLATFKIFVFIIGFKQFYYDVLWCPPAMFLVLGVCRVSWISGFTVFMKFGIFLSIISSNIVFVPPPYAIIWKCYQGSKLEQL